MLHETHSILWSLDSLLLGFSATVVSWTFAVVGFLYFMGWLGHVVPRLDVVGLLIWHSANYAVRTSENRSNRNNFVKVKKAPEFRDWVKTARNLLYVNP